MKVRHMVHVLASICCSHGVTAALTFLRPIRESQLWNRGDLCSVRFQKSVPVPRRTPVNLHIYWCFLSQKTLLQSLTCRVYRCWLLQFLLRQATSWMCWRIIWEFEEFRQKVESWLRVRRFTGFGCDHCAWNKAEHAAPSRFCAVFSDYRLNWTPNSAQLPLLEPQSRGGPDSRLLIA